MLQVEFHDMDVARDENGRVIFADGGLPRERATIEIDESQNHKSFARGRVVEIIAASPHRIAPPCPYFSRCGGCDWQHCDSDGQLQAKRNAVVQTLTRIGGLNRGDVEAITAPCIASPVPFAYRNKADFVVSTPERGTLATRFEVGFFARASHQTVDVAACPIQGEINNAILTACRESLRAGMVSPFDAKRGRGVLRRLMARTSSEGEALLCAVTTREEWPNQNQWARWMCERVPQLCGVLRRQSRAQTDLLEGRDWLEETVDDLRLRVSDEGFFQINSALTPQLLATAKRLMAIENGERVVDLFCGVGLFGLSLARDGAQVLGVENNAVAIDDARHNARSNNVKAEFRVENAATELARLKRGEWDKILLDPPREGAASCVPELLKLAPRSIVYVSCDVATLARDIKALSSDYDVCEVVPLDMFPQTRHVETVARLTRRER